ncbi:uncharacterized protein BXZ73DRAFT_100009 [Epithele typhae]|uniref:uncharacterized protein n=1 Tax=Epithele typhae TaxID=378194 RepID=UPI00200856B1|nr:uncharacterized protein BXZ73DRAFT_100009 [Epithele typhae]KAH9937794.1 hypothetical protein BXZ73DRAFT_100009 [Epithele typhae]
MDSYTTAFAPEVKHAPNDTEAFEGEEEDVLADYFEKSALAVRNSFERFEQGCARPVFNYILATFRRRPVRSTFAAVYIALSVLPVLSFIGFSVFVFATSIFVGVATAIVGAACAVGFFGFWLACLLGFFLFVSFNLTLTVITTYLFVRFVMRARDEGPRAALSNLAQETRAQFTRGRKPGPSRRQTLDSSSTSDASLIGGQGDVLGEKVAGGYVDASVNGPQAMA